MALTTGLIAAYECDEILGNQDLQDSHGSNNLSQTNTPATSSSGLVGRCRILDKSSNEYFTTTDPTGIFCPDVFTIMLAVYPTSDPSGNGNIIASRSGTNLFMSWRFYIDGDSIYFTARDAADSNTYTVSTTRPTNNTWSIVEGGYDGDNQTIWLSVNGTVTSTTGPNGINSPNQAFRIGFFNSSITFDQFDGRIDQVYCWSRTLEDYERTWLYNSGAYRSYSEVAAIVFPFEEVAEGGIRAAGQANAYKRIIKSASGGAVVAGQATKQTTTNLIGTGGVLAAGQATNTKIVIEIAAGGVLAAGQANTQKTTAVLAAGGVLAAGLATNTKVVIEIAAGGVLAAGQATNTKVVTEIAAGGVEAAGQATSSTYLVEVADGGILAAGEATPATLVSLVASGGAVAAGQSNAFRILPITASGGAEAAGQANAFKLVPIVASGGAVAAGQANAFRLVPITAAGGAVAAGQGTSQTTCNLIGTGGAVSAGQAHSQALYGLFADGGSQAAGQAHSYRLVSLVGAGGIQAGGNLTTQIISNLQAAGGVSANGLATPLAIYSTSATGGVEASGQNQNTVITTLVIGGGVIAGGLSMPQQVEKLIDESFRKFLLDAYPAWVVQQNFNIQSTNEPRIFFQRSSQETELLLNSVGLSTTTFDVEIYTDDIDEGQNFAQDMKIVLQGYRGEFGYHTVLLTAVTDHDDDYVFAGFGDGDEGKHIAGIRVEIIHNHN